MPNRNHWSTVKGILGALPMPALAVDRQGQVRAINARALQTLRKTEAAVLAQRADRFVPRHRTSQTAVAGTAAPPPFAPAAPWSLRPLELPDLHVDAWLLCCPEAPPAAVGAHSDAAASSTTVLERQRELAVSLCSARDLSEASAAVLRVYAQLEGVDSGVVYRVDATSGALVLVAQVGLGDAMVASIGRLERDSLLASFSRSGRPVHGHYAKLGFAADPVREAEGLRAVSIVPVCAHRRLVACLAVSSHQHHELPPPTRQEIEAVGALAGRALGRLLAEPSSAVSRAHFRAVVDLLPAAVFEVDMTGRVEFLNRSALEQGGYTAADVESGLNAADLVIEEDAPRVRANMVRVLTGETRGAHEYQALRKNGERFPCLLHAAPIDTAQGPIGLRGVIIDVTERRRAEQAQRRLAGQLEQAMKLEAVGRLAGGVAHDFNNLLTTVLGYASLAQLSIEPTHAVGPMLAEIQRAAESGAQLTQHLLTFSRKQAVAPAVIDLNEVVRSMAGMLGRLLGESITLTLELAASLGPVFADSGQLQQILVNLAVNARDAMPSGGTLTIRSGQGAGGAGSEPAHDHSATATGTVEPAATGVSDEVWLSLADDGTGMDEATVQHIFEPFFTTKPRGRGTGLGLAMVYGAVRQHGGDVVVASRLGHGTTVTLRYPRWLDTQGSEQEEPSANLVGGSERILVVEDDPLVRDMVCRVLERLGYHVIACRNGVDALKACEQGDAAVDLLVTDVVMPKMSGPALAQQLVERSAGLDVLFTSGHGAEVVSHHGLRENFGHFLPKPYTPRQLAHKIREILDSR